jgi:hypothetical protein
MSVETEINFFNVLCYFPHSHGMNSVGDEGAVAIAEAVKKMNNLQQLE